MTLVSSDDDLDWEFAFDSRLGHPAGSSEEPMAKRSKKRCEELPILHPDAAGIDVGASELFVAVSADRDPQPVRSFPTSSANAQPRELFNNQAPELGLGLATGTRLRARLESAASTAVRTPVLAVIEYNYERATNLLPN